LQGLVEAAAASDDPSHDAALVMSRLALPACTQRAAGLPRSNALKMPST